MSIAHRGVGLLAVCLLAACQAPPTPVQPNATPLEASPTAPATAQAAASATPAPASSTDPTPTATPAPVLTGRWASPKDGATLTSSTVVLSAKATVSPADTLVTKVAFTVAWGADKTRTACTATKPDAAGTWSCRADLGKLGAPLGRLTLSSDMSAGDQVATAPAGVRTATYAASPVALVSSKGCLNVAAGIDATGGYHLVADCAGKIRYWSRGAKAAWSATTFAVPAKREDSGPLIGFLGNVVVVAWSRIAVDPGDGGCGSGGFTDLGVYYRTRTLPDGAWSTPVKVGSTGDVLAAFRAGGGTLYLAVQPASGAGMVLRTVSGSTVRGYPIKAATGGIALRIGSDGRVRVAYGTESGLRYGTFSGSTFSTAPIAGTGSTDLGPVLALGADDAPVLAWLRDNQAGGGCAVPDPDPTNGTYLATKAGSAWTVSRVSKAIASTAVAVDQTTGRLCVLVAGESGVRYLTRPVGGSWTATALTKGSASSPVLLLDPFTGVQLVAYVAWAPSGSTSVRVFTRS